ncbi:coilin-like isoform X1 [Vicia villosa]|uniref:coilin-like isoform X1 n=1 Tax=Vicia villosa TaxID=3911 RepID=UPI00273BC983|nr:coilin-like isoform X1 [Vicia villosa]
MTTAMTEKVRLRLFFDDPNMLSKSKTNQGLNRCWFLLKPHLTTISDLTSHLQTLFRLQRFSPAGITLSMDGFVLPSFESTCILKDKDIVCVRRKGSRLTDGKPAMLPLEACENRSIEALELLAIEGIQEERREYETVNLDDDDDVDNDQTEDVVYVEAKSDGNTTSKKRKASKKLKSPSQKKIKMSTTDNLSVIPEVNDEENGSLKDGAHRQPSPAKKSSKKLSKKSSNRDLIKQKDDQNGSTSDETRSLQPQGEGETKKLPSRSARRKKAKRKWLRELKLKEKENENENEKEKLHLDQVLEKDDQQLPTKDKNCIVADVLQQSDEESEADDDMVPVEIKPGHIRFQSRGKDKAVPENQFPVDTFQWSGTTSKKKGQKWGKERTSSHKQDDYEQPRQDFPTVQNAGKKNTFDAVDFEKLTPYTDLPKEGNVIAYRLIELSESWTPEISSFRVGKVTQFDSKSNRIWLETVSEYPFDFRKKIDDLDDDATPAQYDPSPYQEDGSLEIDYVSLADVRIIKHGHSNLATVVASNDALVTPSKATNRSTDALVTPTKATNNSTVEKHVGNQTPVGSSKPQKEGHTPAKENGEVNVWDEINEALKAKKARLSQGDGWKKDDSSSNRPWSQRAKCSALGPTMALLRSQNGFKK